LAGSELPVSAIEQIGVYYDSAIALGRKTAGMHLALASSSSDPAFSPEPFTMPDAGRLAADFTEHAALVFDTLKENLARLPDELLERASLVLSLRRRLLNRFAELGSTELDCVKMRVHGDYHLGQVLHVANDYVILDFEGEPARPLEERRAKQSALKDVAGMLRSFSYAAYASLFAHTARGPDEAARLEPCAQLWECVVSTAFLKSYCAAAEGAPFLPKQGAAFRSLLEAFLLDKALYELRYELNNRPKWVCIPLWGILSLIQGSAARV
jgi:maltose alpha-D-glucosyltransferase/alpha-amylase